MRAPPRNPASLWSYDDPRRLPPHGLWAHYQRPEPPGAAEELGAIGGPPVAWGPPSTAPTVRFAGAAPRSMLNLPSGGGHFGTAPLRRTDAASKRRGAATLRSNQEATAIAAARRQMNPAFLGPQTPMNPAQGGGGGGGGRRRRGYGGAGMGVPLPDLLSPPAGRSEQMFKSQQENDALFERSRGLAGNVTPRQNPALPVSSSIEELGTWRRNTSPNYAAAPPRKKKKPTDLGALAANY